MLKELSATATLDQSSWETLDQLIGQLESRWRQGQPVKLAELDLPVPGVLRKRALVELIKVDQDFRFRAGEPRRLEEYFREWPELAASPAIAAELITAECLTQAAHGSVPTREEVRARFPELSDKIELPDTEIFAAHSAATRRLGRGPVAAANLLGRAFGRYEIRALLGHGGMGTVCRAMDRQLGREVALKVPRADLVDDPVVLERFLREARAAAGVRHPHVCPIFDIGEFEGTYYLSMALVEGESLAALLHRGPLPPGRATELIRKLANALAKMHQAVVVHRDIKPANVMIDETGEPLLMDFGLARLAESQVHEKRIEETAVSPSSDTHSQLSGSALLGTPAYMSPEQAGGDPQAVDARTDLYSLGVVLPVAHRTTSGRRSIVSLAVAAAHDPETRSDAGRHRSQGDGSPPAGPVSNGRRFRRRVGRLASHTSRDKTARFQNLAATIHCGNPRHGLGGRLVDRSDLRSLEQTAARGCSAGEQRVR